MTPGQRNSITDVAGLKVGHAQNAKLKSGTTVLTADAPFVASVHVMGGAPGTRETDLLAPDKSVAAVDALVLSGGSAFGLDACGGVMEELCNAGRGFAVGAARVPIVPGAIVFDLLNGGNKNWSQNPYPALGRSACATAQTDFAIGSVGAGAGALTGTLKGGLGTASLLTRGGHTVGALVVANPRGSVTTPGDRYFYAAPFETGTEFGGFGPDPSRALGLAFEDRKQAATRAQGNTTIAVVATDAMFDKAQCHRVAVAAHDGIARAVVPAHTPLDGDLVFSVSTGTRSLKDPLADVSDVGHAAALCLSRAIARAVYSARPAAGDLLPCWAALNGG
ncbi:MAG: P1 family peptidase [Pseudomonadota bacterium]